MIETELFQPNYYLVISGCFCVYFSRSGKPLHLPPGVQISLQKYGEDNCTHYQHGETTHQGKNYRHVQTPDKAFWRI